MNELHPKMIQLHPKMIQPHPKMILGHEQEGQDVAFLFMGYTIGCG